jgi:site-specific DNA-methyltransferase (adenine-specific)
MPVAFLESSVLYCEDNLRQLAQFPSECIDLIYLDPPFFSNRNYEVIWGDEAEVRSFEDRWAGGIDVYIDWMSDRVRPLHRVLRPTGSLYLHCDPHASHYLKIMLDAIFGPEKFVNEIVWKRSSAHSDGRQGARHFGRVTDTILFYSKSEHRTFNPVYQPYDQEYIDRDYRRVEPETGRRYRIDNLQGPGGAAKGNPFYEVMGVSRYWRYTQENMERLIAEGRVIQTRPGAVPQYKRYLDEMPGVPAQNLWTDLPQINNRSRERLGYPTQKPESLLRRIIGASSNKGDIVLDPFCGCGTTVAVAEAMGRQWVGIDISPTAVNIMNNRIRKATRGRCAPKVVGLPVTEDDLRGLKPFEFQNWVIQKVWGTHSPRKSGDMGIDGYSFMVNDPIQVKQSDRVGRNVVDNFETAVERAGKDKGYIVAFSFTRGAREEVARARWEKKMEIQLVTVKQLLQPQRERNTPLLPGPAPVIDLPLPVSRPREARPTAQELVESDRAAAF